MEMAEEGLRVELDEGEPAEDCRRLARNGNLDRRVWPLGSCSCPRDSRCCCCEGCEGCGWLRVLALARLLIKKRFLEVRLPVVGRFCWLVGLLAKAPVMMSFGPAGPVEGDGCELSSPLGGIELDNRLTMAGGEVPLVGFSTAEDESLTGAGCGGAFSTVETVAKRLRKSWMACRLLLVWPLEVAAVVAVRALLVLVVLSLAEASGAESGSAEWPPDGRGLKMGEGV
jgi:hypothetical protein